MKNWLKNFGIGVLLGFVIVFLIAWLAYTVFILKRDPALANAYVAVGTLILALVTALLAMFTYLSVKSGYDREKRERRERLLNKIIEWAIEVGGEELELNPKMLRAKGHYAGKICLPSWSDLQNAIDDVMKGLDQYIQCTESHQVPRKDTVEQVRTLTTKVIEEAAKIEN